MWVRIRDPTGIWIEYSAVVSTGKGLNFPRTWVKSSFLVEEDPRDYYLAKKRPARLASGSHPFLKQKQREFQTLFYKLNFNLFNSISLSQIIIFGVKSFSSSHHSKKWLLSIFSFSMIEFNFDSIFLITQSFSKTS